MSSLAAALLLFYALVLAYGTWNALRRPTRSGPTWSRPMWLPAMLTAELLPLRLLAGAVIVALLVLADALDHPAGRLALVVVCVSWIGQLGLVWRSLAAGPAVARSLADAGIDVTPFVRIDLMPVIVGYPYRVGRAIERVEGLRYDGTLQLDLYRSRNGHGGHVPVLVQVHGGSWGGGHRRQQGRPLIDRMSESGWIAVAPTYPLAPEHRFPEQLVALKRAIAWLRDNADDLGIDPAIIAVTGGSAGGHLAAMLALTGSDPAYQPGFEDADTTVAAAVPFYGIYDLLNRADVRDPYWSVMENFIGAGPDEAEGRYREASPLDRVGKAAPPFLIVHGSHDSLVPAAEGRAFAEALARVAPRITYLEVPGATHAFDTIHSVRTHHVISGVHAFLEAVREGR